MSDATASPPKLSGKRFLVVALPALLFALFAFSLLFIRSMETGYSHDENQFLASSYLLAEQGLLPYVDYPYFHMPNLVLVYGLLFLQVSTYLFWTRLFSVLCATAIIVLVWLAAVYFFRRRSTLTQVGIALGAGLLLLGGGLFNYGTGRVWNHASSGLLLVLAVIIFLYGSLRPHAGRWYFLAGVLLGAAAGVRLSLLTSALAFGAFVFLDAHTGRLQAAQGLRRAAWLLGGWLVGLLPALFLFWLAPDRFVFGNLTYARLNTAFRQATDYDQAMTLGGKINVALYQVLDEPTNLAFMLLGLLFIYLLGFLWMRARQRLDYRLAFFMLLVFLTVCGAFLPTPFFTQYLFVAAPVVMLGVVYALSRLEIAEDGRLLQQFATAAYLLVVVLTLWYGYRDLQLLQRLDQFRRWYPIQVHTLGNEIRSRVDHGKILTLAPIYAMEAGLDIYPELATGPFAWRTAPLLSPADRQRYGMLAPQDLQTLLTADPPAAILTGKNPDVEQALIDYAEANEFQSHSLDEDLTLWVNPVNPAP